MVISGGLIAILSTPAGLNLDGFFALEWGQDLGAGSLPQYDSPGAPTPHPLITTLGGAVPDIERAPEIFRFLLAASLGAVAVATFRLGQTLFSWPVGLIAAGLILLRPPLLKLGVLGYQDLPWMALVLWAGVLEIRRPRRGRAVLVLLALGGLIRPETWVFAGAYWLWLSSTRNPRERLADALLVAVAPLIWVIGDLAVTGEPLYSFLGTREGAEALGRESGLISALIALPRELGEVLRVKESLIALAGLALGLLCFRERMKVPLALVALNSVTFVAAGAVGLPLNQRYVFLSVGVLCVLAALAIAGWTGLPHGRLRTTAASFGVLCAAVLLVSVPAHIKTTRSVVEISGLYKDVLQDDLRQLLDEPTIGRALDTCPRVVLSGLRAKPQTAFYAKIPHTNVVSTDDQEPTRATYIQSRGWRSSRLESFVRTTSTRDLPDGLHHVGSNRSWVVLSSC